MRTLADIRRDEYQKEASQFGLIPTSQAFADLQREKLDKLQSQGGPSKEFEEFYYKYMEPDKYKQKYGAKNK